MWFPKDFQPLIFAYLWDHLLIITAVLVTSLIDVGLEKKSTLTLPIWILSIITLSGQLQAPTEYTSYAPFMENIHVNNLLKE